MPFTAVIETNVTLANLVEVPKDTMIVLAGFGNIADTIDVETGLVTLGCVQFPEKRVVAAFAGSYDRNLYYINDEPCVLFKLEMLTKGKLLIHGLVDLKSDGNTERHSRFGDEREEVKIFAADYHKACETSRVGKPCIEAAFRTELRLKRVSEPSYGRLYDLLRRTFT